MFYRLSSTNVDLSTSIQLAGENSTSLINNTQLDLTSDETFQHTSHLEIANNLRTIHYQTLLGEEPISEELILQTLEQLYQTQQLLKFWDLLDYWLRIKPSPSAYGLKSIISNLIEAGEFEFLEKLIEFVNIRDRSLALHLGQYLLNLGISTNSDLDLVKFIFNLNYKNYLLLSTKQFSQLLVILGLNYHPLLNNLLNNFQLDFLFNQLTLKRRLPYILDLITLIQKVGVELNTATYNLLIKSIASINPQLALKFFDNLQLTQKENFKPNTQTYLNLVWGIAVSKGELTRAHNLMNKLPSTLPRYFKLILSNVLLKGYFKNRSLPIALDYFYEMKKHYRPDLVTLTIVLTQLNNDSRYVKTDIYLNALKTVHEEIKNYKKTPNHLTLNLLFQCYLKVDLEEAYKIGEQIETHAEPPTIHYYTTRITHALRQSPANLDEALRYLNLFIIRKFPLNNDIVSEIFTEIKLKQDIERVERFRKLLHKANYMPSIDQLIDNFIIRINLDLPPLTQKKWRSKFYRN
jgi:hypothetical protein